jgi:hypothetical protein
VGLGYCHDRGYDPPRPNKLGYNCSPKRYAVDLGISRLSYTNALVCLLI